MTSTPAAPWQCFSNWCKAINTARDQGVAGPFYEAAQRTLGELAGVLGVTLTAPVAAAVSSVDVKPFVDLLVDVRTEVRAIKQWALADKIRDQLQEMGIVLERTVA